MQEPFLTFEILSLSSLSRMYAGQYPNYAAAAAMTAQHPHHLGRFQAAGMASMFPPNPMFNLPTHHSAAAPAVPTTPPKGASKSSKTSSIQATSCPTYGTSPVTVPVSSVAVAAAASTLVGSNHKTSTTSLARLQQLTNGLENQAKPSRPNSALLAPGYYPQQPTQSAQAASAAQSSHVAAGQASHDQARMMHQYSQNHMLNYTGYPGYLNPYMNMYHQAAVTDHHQRAASHHQAHPGAGANPTLPPPQHHQMYPGYPALPYNYHR